MREKIYILLLLSNIFSTDILHSQEIKYPFGVEKPLYWLSPKIDKDQIFLEDKISGKVLLGQKKSDYENINGNLGYYLEKNNIPKLELKKESAENYSLFIVYGTNENDKEQNLWSLVSGQGDKLLVGSTNYRLADFFSSGEYRTYPKMSIQSKVKIHYYQHYKKLKEDDKYLLTIGDKKDKLPPEALSGYIAEVIIYDRVLSPMEMQKVASYLAIKYGVSLSQLEYKNYYNHKGEKIWDYEEHKEFNQNITGLGKSFRGNLSQERSQNSNDEQLVSMSYSSLKEVPDDYFVFWSDNGGELKIEKQKEGQPKGFSRVWNLDFSNQKGIELNWQFSPQKLQNLQSENKEKDYYWLILDQTGKGEFASENTQYYRLRKVNDSKNSEIKNFGNQLDTEGKRLAYTIWQAPEMFAHLDIEKGKCRMDERGKIKFNIVGGKAPYEIRLKDLNKVYVDQVWKESQSRGEKNISLLSGRYSYEVRDAMDRSYKQDLYLTDTDAPNPKLNQEYIIKEPIVLSPEKDLPKGFYTYQWYKNGELISTNPNFILKEKGSYELRLKDEYGCHSSSRFMAYTSDIYSVGNKVIVYPNPTTDGRFKLLASFVKKTSGAIFIYTSEGRLIQQKEFYNVSDYEYNGHISVSGMYIIKINTTLGDYSYKLMVQ